VPSYGFDLAIPANLLLFTCLKPSVVIPSLIEIFPWTSEPPQISMLAWTCRFTSTDSRKQPIRIRIDSLAFEVASIMTSISEATPDPIRDRRLMIYS
ncbi:3944_t:CDS:2, partial [Paraglomus occultum]